MSRPRHSIEDRAEELLEQGLDANEAMARAHEESQMEMEHLAESVQDDADGVIDDLWSKVMTAAIQRTQAAEVFKKDKEG